MRDPKIGWIITRDFIAEPDEEDAEGTYGPDSFRGDPETLKRSGRRFRLLDDDGEVYYEGRWNGLEGDEADAFGPLHDFGGPNAGCTEMQYWDKGWRTL